jgi:hypothetical protein
MPGLFTGATGTWGGFAGLLYGSTSLSTPPGLLADVGAAPGPSGNGLVWDIGNYLIWGSDYLVWGT